MGTDNKKHLKTFNLIDTTLQKLKKKTKIINEQILVLKAIEVLCAIIFYRENRNVYLMLDKKRLKYNIDKLCQTVFNLKLPNEMIKKVEIDFSLISKINRSIIDSIVVILSVQIGKIMSDDQFVNLAIIVFLHFICIIKEEGFETYFASEKIEYDDGEILIKSLQKLGLRETLRFI